MAADAALGSIRWTTVYRFGAGGLLPRPPPDLLPVVLGQFGLLLMMIS